MHGGKTDSEYAPTFLASVGGSPSLQVLFFWGEQAEKERGERDVRSPPRHCRYPFG